MIKVSLKKRKYKTNLELRTFVTFAKIIMNFCPCSHKLLPKKTLPKGNVQYLVNIVIQVIKSYLSVVSRTGR